MLRKVLSLHIFVLKLQIFIVFSLPEGPDYGSQGPKLPPGICVLKGDLDFHGKNEKHKAFK